MGAGLTKNAPRQATPEARASDFDFPTKLPELSPPLCIWTRKVDGKTIHLSFDNREELKDPVRIHAHFHQISSAQKGKREQATVIYQGVVYQILERDSLLERAYAHSVAALEAAKHGEATELRRMLRQIRYPHFFCIDLYPDSNAAVLRLATVEEVGKHFPLATTHSKLAFFHTSVPDTEK